jgi:glycosyltransferase involved in cell wall biosynthesis
MLAGKADVVMAVSAFNATELEAMGHRDVKVLPLFLDREHWSIPPSRRVLGLYDDEKVNLLFVGRGAPNKRIEDLLFAFYFFQKYVEPESRLIHVGSYAGLERYQALLRAKCVELKLTEVHFQGSVRQDELNAYYNCADVFLCMSEHEGFCIPVLEAMAHRVPVLAFAAGAVPETMDGAGLLFKEKQFDHVAEMIGRLDGDEKLRAAVLKKQDERLARYTQTDLAGELRRHLAPLIAQ